ncbi:MAG: PDZ domain-containing protein [Actinobacteria bacterium]|nr:MAG: PDZ domain-containing protein [Actinomycetota bacterium]
MDAVRQRITLPLLGALLAGACIGAGGGAATYAALSSGNSRTVVHQVTVPDSQPAANTSGLSVHSIYELARKGVVKITVSTGASPLGGSSQAQGSGFVYDSDGHVITNQHVVDGAQSVSVQLWNGKSYTAHVVGTDASTDIAVLKVDAPSSQLFPLTLADSSKVAVGDSVVAIGSPFGLQETVTSGIVSALHREMTSPNNFAIDDSIQTDAAINHGNSGGPLLNAQGKVIGVTSQIESDSGGSDGVGFAVPSDTIRSIAAQLISSGKAEHAFLGVVLRDASSSNGAAISQVRSATPAAKAGLKAGDVITALGGKSISTASQLRAAINARRPGDSVSLTYRRGGQSHTVTVKLASRPA